MRKDDITNMRIDLETLSVEEFIARMGDAPHEGTPTVADAIGDHRFAYTIVAEQVDGEGNYIPCVAVENRRGYYPLTGRGPHATPWKWGKDYEKANQVADAMNARMGLSQKDAFKIVTSSMFGPFEE